MSYGPSECQKESERMKMFLNSNKEHVHDSVTKIWNTECERIRLGVTEINKCRGTSTVTRTTNTRKRVDDETSETIGLLITFTLNNSNANVDEAAFKHYMMKCVHTKSQTALRYYGACEYTKIGRLHSHLFIEYVKNENHEGWGSSFIRKITGWKYGYIDVREIKTDNGTSDYVSKDLEKNKFEPIGEWFKL